MPGLLFSAGDEREDGMEFGEGFLGALDNRNPLDLIAAGDV